MSHPWRRVCGTIARASNVYPNAAATPRIVLSAGLPFGRAADRLAMDYLYSLYDALVSINVPNDKARAVVDVMERDMCTTLATKSDLLLLRQEIDNKFTLLSRDIDSLRISTGKDLEALRLAMTVRLGSIVMVGVGVILAAIRLWA